jgi:hypothetical protein
MKIEKECTGDVYMPTVTKYTLSRWCNGYRACHRTQGSRVQTRPTDGLSRTIKICSKTSCGGKVKPSARCPLWYDTDRQNSAAIFRPVSALFAIGCLLQTEQKTLVDKSGTIRAQMGSTIDQKMVSVAWDALNDCSP